MQQLTIDAMGQFGDGLAREDGRQIHVPKVLPGEVVEVEDGRLTRIVTASPDRVEAFCPKFALCGGCKLQHWREAPYAAWKRSLVERALVGKGLDVPVAPLVTAHGAGRRRVSLHVREQGGTWVSGFMEEKSHRLCAIETCPVLVPALKDAPIIAASFGPLLGACDVALTAADNGIDVAVKAERKAVPRKLDGLRQAFERWKLARLAINGEELLAGSAPLMTFGTAHVRLPVNSFLQATEAGEAALSQLVLDGVGKAKSVADLFCGAGPFSFRLARNMAVHGIDSDKAAIAQLLQAARNTQGLKPIKAEVRDLFRAPLIVNELNEFDAVVFDPPRAGAEAQSRMLAASRVKRVVAVACDVQTFARDAAILVAGGYRLEQVVPVDQFKWTAHLELVGWFRK